MLPALRAWWDMTTMDDDRADAMDDIPAEQPLGRPGLSARALINIVAVCLALIVIGVGAQQALRAHPAWLLRLFPYSGTRVYVMLADGSAVLALKAGDGAALWTTPLPTPPTAINARPTPRFIQSSGLLYVTTTTATGNAIFALDERDGTIRWRYQADFSPLTLLQVAGGNLYLTTEVATEDDQPAGNARVPTATLIALDASSGKERWHYQAPGATTLNCAYAPQSIVVGAANATATSTLTALDPSDGSQHWQLQAPDSHVLYPVIVSGTVYVRADHTLTAYDMGNGSQRWLATSAAAFQADYPFVTADAIGVTDTDGSISLYNALDGSLRWHVPILGTQRITAATATSAFVETSIFTADDDTYGLTALDRTTGATQWRYTEALPDSFSTPPLLAGASIYVHLADAVVALDAATGNARWHTPVARPPGGTPLTLAHETLYLGVGNTIVALDAVSGKIRWRTPVGYVALAPLADR